MLFNPLPNLETQITELSVQETSKYFPKNVAQLFGINDEEVSFFGLCRDVAEKDGIGVSKHTFLALLGKNLPAEMASLSFLDSKSKYIRGVGRDILSDDYSILKEQTPLLVLELTTRMHKRDCAFKFTDIFRYADHKALRRRGVATAVFKALNEQLHLQGVKYSYAFPISAALPKATLPIYYRRMPKPRMREIHSSLHPAYLDKDWQTDSCFFLTDRNAHEKLYARVCADLR